MVSVRERHLGERDGIVLIAHDLVDGAIHRGALGLCTQRDEGQEGQQCEKSEHA